MAVTIKDIAQHLNLAPSTVSKALNDYPHIATTTKRRVVEAARELGYYPSAAARDLRRRKTDRIGFLYGYASANIGEYASRIINGAVYAAEEAGYNILLYPLPGDRQEKLTRISKTREVEGLLLLGGENLAESIDLLRNEGIPFMMVNRQIDKPEDVSYVSADHRSAFLEAMHHLFELGHERIAYVGQPSLEEYDEVRRDSYKRAYLETNFAYDETLMVSTDGEFGDGNTAMQYLLSLPDPPTAVIAIHDPLAIECLQTATHAGLRVPGDVAVVGCDNLRASLSTQPPLTTIYPPLAEIGRQAVEALILQLSDESVAPIRKTLPAELVVRQSTSG